MKIHRALVPGLVLLGLVALSAHPAQAQKGDRNKLTVEEIAEKDGISNALEAVKRLRSNWLRIRSSGIAGSSSDDRYTSGKPELAVYVDDTRMQGGVEDLKGVRVDEIVEISFMSGNNALARYGNGHEYGAIFVKTKRGLP
ncbi:MAG: hypothetical protein AAB075_07295 [Gemmatimonadota bacterium]